MAGCAALYYGLFFEAVFGLADMLASQTTSTAYSDALTDMYDSVRKALINLKPQVRYQIIAYKL